MPISNVVFLRSTITLLMVGLATLFVLVALTAWLSMRTQDVTSTVLTGRQIRSALVETRSLLQDTETGQRGYLLTHQDAYLEPYDRARSRIGERLAALRALIGPGPDQEQVTRLERIVSAKLDELAETIDLARAGRDQDALAVVRTDRGRRLMDDARVVFDDLLTETDRRIGQRMEAQMTSITALNWSTLLGAILITLVVGGSALIASRYTRELLAARRGFAALNTTLERRVDERTAALARANEEIQRFAYVVSHDLRSPLVNVMGFTSELESLRDEIFAPGAGGDAGERERLAHEYDEATGFIRSSTARMDKLIGAVLKLARDGGRRIAPEPVDLATLVGQAADTVRHRVLERGGRIVVRDGLPPITSDRLALEQIVGNLLDNAVKYADPARAPEIVVSARMPGERVLIDVADNGLGIDAAHQDRVFDLFNRVGQQDAPGEGIGLAHVRSLARRLGGEITLRSQPGVGTTFTVDLPRDLSAADPDLAGRPATPAVGAA